MTARAVSTCLTAVLWAAVSFPAHAAGPPTGPGPKLCSTHRTHAAYLAKEWGEASVFTGTVGQRFVVRLLFNPKSGTWTLLLIHVSGTSCVKATGKNGQLNRGG